MPSSLYLSSKASPRGASVISELNPVPQAVRDMTQGDVRATNIYVVDGSGAFDAVSGQVGSSVIVGLGLPGVLPVWTNSLWTPIVGPPAGWSGLLAARTADFAPLFTSTGTNPLELELSVRVTDATGNPIVFANPLIKLWKSGIDDGLAASNPFINAGDGEYAIPNGADIGSVTGLGLGLVPRRVLLAVRKPAGGLNLFASVVAGTITTGGFNFTLNGATDAAGYKLDYVLMF